MKKLIALIVCVFLSTQVNATAGPWVVHDAFKLRGYNASNLDITATGNVIKVALATSSSNAATTSVNNYASLTNELSTSGGYTNGGATMSVTWTGTSTVTFALGSNVVWTASSGGFTARFAVMYDNTDSNKTIIAHCLLDATPADIVMTSPNTLTISSGNLFTLARTDHIEDYLIALVYGWPQSLLAA